MIVNDVIDSKKFILYALPDTDNNEIVAKKVFEVETSDIIKTAHDARNVLQVFYNTDYSICMHFCSKEDLTFQKLKSTLFRISKVREVLKGDMIILSLYKILGGWVWHCYWGTEDVNLHIGSNNLDRWRRCPRRRVKNIKKVKLSDIMRDFESFEEYKDEI